MKQKSILLLCVLLPLAALAQKIENFNAKGEQVTRFSTAGDAIDAHDGEIAQFNGVYYLYGTSYDCGFAWGKKGAPFCGFKVYTSTDLQTWTDKGALFDASTQVWQTRCNGNTYGCFRPHVVYNQRTSRYVLWINVYDNVSGYRVFTSKSPVGPFVEVKEPVVAVNANAPAAGLNNGDHDLFIDDDGSCYLAYTDWRAKGTIVIEKLTDDYLSGTGEHVKAVTPGNTEAPGLFKRKGKYYVTYSDPNCGYCSGTGTSYRTASSPLGPWSEGIKISDNSCGGQPSFVSAFKLGKDSIYLYGSDLWNNAAKNEALANYYWTVLEFTEDGAIKPLKCNPSPVKGYRLQCDISRNIQRSQSFKAARNGTLKAIQLTSFKNTDPDSALVVAIYAADASFKPTGQPLAVSKVEEGKIGWSAKGIRCKFSLKLQKGKSYCMVISTNASAGCYGVAYNDDGISKGVQAYSKDNGKVFEEEKGRSLKYELEWR